MKPGKKFFIIYLLVILILQELIFRFLFPVPEISNFNRINYSPLQLSPFEKTPFISNITLLLPSEPDNVEATAHLNIYGFRDKERKLNKSANTKRIMLVGDSMMEGELSSDEKVIPEFFRKLLAENGKEKNMEVMNMGIMGADMYCYLRLINDATAVFHPDYVILMLFSNDLLGDMPHARADQLPPQPFHPKENNLFIPRLIYLFSQIIRKENIVFRWSTREINYFPSVPDPVNPWTKDETYLQQFVTPVIASSMKKGKFNPFVTNNLMEVEQRIKNPVDVRRELFFLKSITEKFNSRIMIAFLPSRHLVSQYYLQFEKQYCGVCPDTLNMTGTEYEVKRKNLAEQCSSMQIPFLDLTPFIKEEEDRGNHLYWNFDEHLRDKGNELIAGKMYDWFMQTEK